jgi:hypothetical protein
LVIRKLAGIALAAGVLVSVSGCSFSSSPESLQSYAPSDGVGITLAYAANSNNSVEFSNMLVLTDGTQHVLFGTVTNDGADDQTITMRSVKTGQSFSFVILSGGVHKFNTSNLVSLPLDGSPGDTVQIEVGPDGAGKYSLLNVPVLDGTIDYYSGLLDTPTPAPSVTPSVSPTPAN